METKKFKTNAACGGCAARIGKSLARLVPESQFTIETSTPDKVLTITSDLSVAQIVGAVEEAGYKAVLLPD